MTVQTKQLEQAFFGSDIPVVVVGPPSVSSSVSQSVSQSVVTDGLTDLVGVGEDLTVLNMEQARVVLPALIGQIVNQPIEKIIPLQRYGRVMVAQVIPSRAVDPILPWIAQPRSLGYQQWYRHYWAVLMRSLAGWPGARRAMASAERRLLMQLDREGLTPREYAFFRVWLSHAPLGDYRFVEG